jgi:hypothetical protein
MWGAAAASYTAQGVLFDGSTDNLLYTSALTGAPSATKTALISFWFKMMGGNGNDQLLLENTGQYVVYRPSDNTMAISYGGSILAKTTSTFTSGGGWKHFLGSFDLAASACHIYINDASDLASPTLINANMDFSGTITTFGCTSGGTLRLNAEIADFYFNPGTYLDLSNSTNRRKFISAGGAPVDLGSDGSTPTGSAPTIYFSGSTASWHTNDGAGGGFSSAATLTDASNNPP